MSFLRPELAARLSRGREAVAWSAALALGLWLMWRGYAQPEPLQFVVGLLLAGAGFGLLRGALRRLRLGIAEVAEGVVVIDEARIGFYGPRGGGFVDLPAVVAVHVSPMGAGHAWLIDSEDGTRLAIPTGARGAEGLVDALGVLPGIDFDAAAEALARAESAPSTIWRRSARSEARRLR